MGARAGSWFAARMWDWPKAHDIFFKVTPVSLVEWVGCLGNSFCTWAGILGWEFVGSWLFRRLGSFGAHEPKHKCDPEIRVRAVRGFAHVC